MPDWPHGPRHRLPERGAYMLTARTYDKALIFNSRAKLDLLQNSLLEVTARWGAELQAWCVFPNHYHCIACFRAAPTLHRMFRELHSTSARSVNEIDRTSNRKVWFQYWETLITYQRSYYPRLRYVHENAVRHGVVKNSALYPWCSAGWLERVASPAFRKTLSGFTKYRLEDDDFELPKLDEIE
jgi:putative transposase